MKCYLFDLDGTLCDLTHRLHHIQKEPKDWDAFFDACGDDPPIEHVVGLCRTLMVTTANIVFVSGRSERVREATSLWLNERGLFGSLYMRKDDDHRPDYIIKKELLAQIRADGYEPIMAFDDRDQVVKMWRENGIPCAQVAEGSF